MIVGDASTRLTPGQYRMLTVLLCAAPNPVDYDALISLLWGDCEDGGPEYVRVVLRVHLCGVRKALVHLNAPVAIETLGYGGRLRLVEARAGAPS